MDGILNEQPLMNVILKVLAEEQWYFQEIEGKPAVRAGFHGEHGTWVCYINVDEDRRQVVIYSLMGLNIPAQKRTAVMEYLTRVNYILRVGNFEMDVDQGEVRFRTSLETPEGELSLAMARALIYTNVHTIDYYAPGVMAVLHSDLSPEASLARIETQPAGSSMPHE
jgi:hypothetical protein